MYGGYPSSSGQGTEVVLGVDGFGAKLSGRKRESDEAPPPAAFGIQLYPSHFRVFGNSRWLVAVAKKQKTQRRIDFGKTLKQAGPIRGVPRGALPDQAGVEGYGGQVHGSPEIGLNPAKIR